MPPLADYQVRAMTPEELFDIARDRASPTLAIGSEETRAALIEKGASASPFRAHHPHCNCAITGAEPCMGYLIIETD